MLPIMSGDYSNIEARIKDACLKLSELRKLSIATIAPEYSVLEGRLRAQAVVRQLRSQRRVANKQPVETGYFEEGYSLETN